MKTVQHFFDISGNVWKDGEIIDVVDINNGNDYVHEAVVAEFGTGDLDEILNGEEL